MAKSREEQKASKAQERRARRLAWEKKQIEMPGLDPQPEAADPATAGEEADLHFPWRCKNCDD